MQNLQFTIYNSQCAKIYCGGPVTATTATLKPSLIHSMPSASMKVDLPAPPRGRAAARSNGEAGETAPRAQRRPRKPAAVAHSEHTPHPTTPRAPGLLSERARRRRLPAAAERDEHRSLMKRAGARPRGVGGPSGTLRRASGNWRMKGGNCCGEGRVAHRRPADRRPPCETQQPCLPLRKFLCMSRAKHLGAGESAAAVDNTDTGMRNCRVLWQGGRTF